MSIQKSPLLLGVGIGLFSGNVFGEETQLSIIQNAGHSEINWTTDAERYYYLQVSNDLNFLPDLLFPYATLGDGKTRILGVSNSGGIFYRLMILDDPNDPFLYFDRDSDTFADFYELNLGSDPFESSDLDGDGIPDDIQVFWQANPNDWKEAFIETDYWDDFEDYSDIIPEDDPDGDGLSNLAEFVYRTSALSGDSDGDGMWDAFELSHNLNPVVADEELYPDNEVPIAQIIVDKLDGNPPLEIAFSGSTSYDVDGRIVSWEWELDGDRRVDSDQADFDTVYWDPGRYEVSLVVFDDGGQSSEANVEIFVNDPPMLLVDISHWKGAAPLQVSFDAGSSFDLGEIISFEWDVGEDGIVEGTGSQFSYTFENAGIYPVLLSLTDDYFVTEERVYVVWVTEDAQPYSGDVEINLRSDSQIEGNPGEFIENIGQLQIVDAEGNGIPDYPVVFRTSNGSVRLLDTSEDSSSMSSEITLSTNFSGYLSLPHRIGFQLPAEANAEETVEISAGTSTVTLTFTTSASTRPKAPSNVTVVNNPDGTTTYSWTDNSDNEDSFEIWEEGPNGVWMKIATVSSDVRSYTH